MAELPIIVLAFANEQEGRRYLRDLPEELRRLQDILKDAERNGLCRLELLPNATLDQIFDVFTRNRDQVTILHYAGHADSGRLLLESNAAGGAPAHAAGLATFLGQCGGLQLVFLNGCSTRAQVARLIEAGVAAVIATARAIDDGMARAFAVAFYTELASGFPLRAAYEKARGRVLAAHDTVPEAYYGHRDLGTASAAESANPDPTDDHGFPWEFRPGTELVERWSLPDAAGNPEFGLPRLPDRDLPETPFRHLNWFTAEHAEVFFGRGYQVRELYEQVTDTSGPPILLLYGASGVGKSSLLDAGLMPRLESGGSAVRYCRRDQQKGLLGTLRGALELGAEPTALGEVWRAEEARLGKPLVIFLDQVEEVFTRPDAAQPHELDELLTGLVAALGNRETRPRGKLVLGFRKEWLAELDRRLAEAKLPRTPVFLQPLDRRGIISAIGGPARPGRLQRQYRLSIQDGLPEVIADDLLADAGSALSSTLQVLLAKMWERARQANPDQPRFDRAIYEALKAQGYLLKDVLDEGLKNIGRWNPAVEQSGLALDVLVYHTTDLGTSAQRTRAELAARYAHQAGVLDGLLSQCKDNYLIVEAEPHPESPTRSTRLAHDLLAPLVQQRFRLSVAPGQRARRLLENRVPDWADGKTGPHLDRADLATVVEGASGMRAWADDEDRLVKASRAEDERLRAQEAEEARRLHEAEAGRLRAEAQARQEAEHRLEEQQKANQRQIEDNQRLEEANQRLEEAGRRQKLSNQRLRQGTYLLGAAAAIMVVVTSIAFYEGSVARRMGYEAITNLNKYKSEERLRSLAQAERSLAQAEELLEADPQAVPDILTAVRKSEDAMDRLRDVRSRPGSSKKESGRAALALLETDPSEADFLLHEVLASDSTPDELLLVRKYLVPYLSRETGELLWQTVKNIKTAPDLRLRHAAVVAAIADNDARWIQVAERVVADILTVNALQLGDWTDAFRVVKRQLIPPLELKFNEGEQNEREVAATILNDYAADDIFTILALLKNADAHQYRILFAKAKANPEEAVKSMTEEVAFDLLKDADARQFPILLTKAKDNPAAAVKAMKAEIGKKSPLRSIYKQKDELAGRQANALITLAMLGQTDRLWPALRTGPDPRLRSYLIQRMGRLGVDYNVLVGRLFDEKDASIRAAIVLALGEYPYDLRIGEINRLVAARLLAEYGRDPDPGFHSAVAWLLPNLLCFDGQTVDESLAGKKPDPQQEWFVNKAGQAFVILKDPGVFVMGSSDEENEFGRNPNEQLHHRRIPRSFAISTHEVTVADYTRFLDDPAAKETKSNFISAVLRDYSPKETGPILSVTWFEAAQYCRWLSEQEGIRETEQCYPPLPLIKEGMELYPDYLTRTGYRLPTEAEWEYACRAGSQTPWTFGSDKALLKDFSWYLDNSITKNIRQQAQETGQKKPNAFGLFDMHGNVNEWCSDRTPTYPTWDSPPVDDDDRRIERPDRKVLDVDSRVYRGGSFGELPLNLRSAYRDAARPTSRWTAIGFRVVRTYPPRPG